MVHTLNHSGKSATMRESNHGSDIHVYSAPVMCTGPEMYVRSITGSTLYQKSSILLAGTGVCKISSVACGFSSIEIEYSDYLKIKV